MYGGATGGSGAVVDMVGYVMIDVCGS